MGAEEAKKPGALRELGKQRAIVAGQPPLKRAITDAFERMQEPQSDYLTGPEVGLGMFRDSAQLLIDLREHRCDQIHCGHGLLCSWPGCTLSTSVEEVHVHDNKASKYYYIYWFVSD
jgi:hypothetical protein